MDRIMAEQIHWAAPRGTRDGLKMLADKAGLKGNMSGLLTMLLMEYAERQPEEVKQRITIQKMMTNITKKRTKKSAKPGTSQTGP